MTEIAQKGTLLEAQQTSLGDDPTAKAFRVKMSVMHARSAHVGLFGNRAEKPPGGGELGNTRAPSM